MKISTASCALIYFFSLVLIDVVFSTVASTTIGKKQKTSSTKPMMDKQSRNRLSLDDTSKMMGKRIRHKKSSYDVHDGSYADEEEVEARGSVEEEDEDEFGSAEEEVVVVCNNNTKLLRIPTEPDDFDEPAWMDIIEIAFPPWNIDQDECGRLTSVEDGGKVHAEYPMAVRDNSGGGGGGKWNPCYYTKRFDGLDPKYGGYPTPIDTNYPYAFAAPFYGQPGDGSVHHCNIDSNFNVDIGRCPILGATCGQDCAEIGRYGIPYIPAHVPLAAVKNAYQEAVGRCRQEDDICSTWFNYDTNRCDIQKSVLDQLVDKYFGNGGTIKFEPPVLLNGKPSNTYYRLQFGGETPACDAGGNNCQGAHYCSTRVAQEGSIWADFCPYVHTGPNAGKYRHPHIALAALQQWIAHECMPDKCDSTWDEGPFGYPPTVSTSITWCEMQDNDSHVSQPRVPYKWPIDTGGGGGGGGRASGDGEELPGPDLYYGFKAAPGVYVNELVTAAVATALD